MIYLTITLILMGILIVWIIYSTIRFYTIKIIEPIDRHETEHYKPYFVETGSAFRPMWRSKTTDKWYFDSRGMHPVSDFMNFKLNEHLKELK